MVEQVITVLQEGEQEQELAIIQESGYSAGYNVGYSKGHDDGYSEGYDDGYDEGYAIGYDNGLANAGGTYEKGYNDGYTEGRTKGHEEGYEEGYAEGHDVGYDVGHDEGYSKGRTDGYNEGYTQGRTDGYNEGYNKGYDTGYDTGKTDGQQIGYENGYSTGYTEGENAGIEAGRELGQSDVWDMVQNFGNRTNYNRAFSTWSGIGFKPKYPISTTSCDYLFNGFAKDVEEGIDFRQFEFDTSPSTSFSYMCNGSRITAFGTIDTTNSPDIKNIFYQGNILHTVEKLILKDDGSQTAGANVFHLCYALTNIIIQGKWGKSVSVQSSSKLSKASIYSFVNALSDTATGQTLTLSKTAVKKAFETSEGANDGITSAEWNALVNTKLNWTIAV